MQVNFNKRQFVDSEGKISILETNPDGTTNYVVPLYVVGQGNLLPEEKLELITDREAQNIAPIYAISNYGRVWHIYKHMFMSPGYTRAGYVTYPLQRRSGGPCNFRAHRLVMLKYRYFEGCEDSKKYEVNHINGIKTDNYVDVPNMPDNLEWTSRVDNSIHAIETGLHNFDDRQFYTDEQIKKVCELLKTGLYSHNQISSMTGVKYYTVTQIFLRNQWTHISNDYNF